MTRQSNWKFVTKPASARMNDAGRGEFIALHAIFLNEDVYFERSSARIVRQADEFLRWAVRGVGVPVEALSPRLQQFFAARVFARTSADLGLGAVLHQFAATPILSARLERFLQRSNAQAHLTLWQDIQAWLDADPAVADAFAQTAFPKDPAILERLNAFDTALIDIESRDPLISHRARWLRNADCVRVIAEPKWQGQMHRLTRRLSATYPLSPLPPQASAKTERIGPALHRSRPN
ncbi:MAG: hypothetical protein MRY63_08820 [Neomegalonema sp.]|nr:hypothetical protein [Neomegalonema sp.]